jgi:hypothetical protein
MDGPLACAFRCCAASLTHSWHGLPSPGPNCKPKRTLVDLNKPANPSLQIGSYLVPLVLRMTVYRSKFKPGPFNLGAASGPVNLIAIAWACLAIVLFALPQVRGLFEPSLDVLMGRAPPPKPHRKPRSPTHHPFQQH